MNIEYNLLMSTGVIYTEGRTLKCVLDLRAWIRHSFVSSPRAWSGHNYLLLIQEHKLYIPDPGVRIRQFCHFYSLRVKHECFVHAWRSYLDQSWSSPTYFVFEVLCSPITFLHKTGVITIFIIHPEIKDIYSSHKLFLETSLLVQGSYMCLNKITFLWENGIDDSKIPPIIKQKFKDHNNINQKIGGKLHMKWKS